MPESPDTPNRRRPSSSYSQRPRTTSQTSVSSLHYRSNSRRSSNQSLFSPGTPRADLGGLNELGFGGTGGLGSLADELAEEDWDESRVEQKYTQQEHVWTDKQVEGQSPTTLSPSLALETKTVPASGYDGSDYGEEDLEIVAGITLALEKRIADVEALARQGTGDNDTKETGVIARVAAQLCDLSPQAVMETQITRLSTSHTAITSSLTHQSRLLTTLTQHLFSPLVAPPDPQSCAEASELISDLKTLIPTSTRAALDSLHNLHILTAELASLLSQLVDSLQMMRQTNNDATRRLRSVNEVVSRLRKELDEAEDARRYLERGRWDEKIKNKEASKTCREVVQGFEAICEQWRARIIQTGGGKAELVATS